MGRRSLADRHITIDSKLRAQNVLPPQIKVAEQPTLSAQAEPTPPQTPILEQDPSPPSSVPAVESNGKLIDQKLNVPQSSPSSLSSPIRNETSQPAQSVTLNGQASKYRLKRPNLLGRTNSQENENPLPQVNSPPATASPKQLARRTSWISSLSSKFSSPGTSPSAQTSSFETKGPKSPTAASSGYIGDSHSVSNNKAPGKGGQKSQDRPALGSPRRPSVLVQAGREREDHTSFLQSALRKLSTGGSAFGHGAVNDQANKRRVMNVDRHRDRVRVADLESSNLRRVAFCVDVEVAGHASWHEVEEFEAERRMAQAVHSPTSGRQNMSVIDRHVQGVKSKKDRKNEKRDGNENKVTGGVDTVPVENPSTVRTTDTKQPESTPSQAFQESAIPVEAEILIKTPEEHAAADAASTNLPTEPQPAPNSRKKEKKKKSEAERKERKDKRRRRAEDDGEVPIEIVGGNGDENDDDDHVKQSTSLSPPKEHDATSSSTTKSQRSSISHRTGHSPTTNPLRIYKRCAQLRETTVVDIVCRQISSPPATLSDSPGTIAVLDLSKTVMSLPELITLGDWLAVVPVRKILLEDCELTDEAVRVILAGLLACKTTEQARYNRRLFKKADDETGEEQLGVVEKVSLKGNAAITKRGWRHIALFLHLSRSLRAIDLSGIPFQDGKTSTESAQPGASKSKHDNNFAGKDRSDTNGSGLRRMLAESLTQRFGSSTLEELVMNNCHLASADVSAITEAASKCKLRRLGLAGNSLDEDGLRLVGSYIATGICEGLDLSNNDLHNGIQPLTDSLVEGFNFYALGLSGCNLSPCDLKALLPSLVSLKNFRFVDLSGNQGLFSTHANILSLLRRYLPQMKSLRRIHLNDVGLSSEPVIALAEILPECPSLTHLSILDNQAITDIVNSKDGPAQEEACALFAALLTAVRMSSPPVTVDIEVPSSDSSEIVKALASRVVAYTLRNMEQGTLQELEGAVPSQSGSKKQASEILLQLVGDVQRNKTDDDSADATEQEDDYLMGGNAIVKALSVCLGTIDDKGRTASGSGTPNDSGMSTPKMSQGENRGSECRKKAWDMSKELLECARKIKVRVAPALVREDRAGNHLTYRKLHQVGGQFLSFQC